MGTSGSLVSFQPPAEMLTYETSFGLKEKAFSLDSDPRFLYPSPSYTATFENLLGGIRRREGLLVLTGEIGTGKTTLCRAVLRNLGRKTFSSFVADPFASREDLLKMLLLDFGVVSIQELTTGSLRGASRTELSYLLSAFLESLTPLDAFVVAVIDEAQNMSLPLIEETRILSDSPAGKGRLQIVFVGQPELHAKLKLPDMRHVDQRVCGYNRLAPLGRDAVAGYVQHRLQVAGGSRERVLFPPDVIDLLHRRSGGVPRLIHRICDRALHLAHRRQAASVDVEILEAALLEIGSTTAPVPSVAAPTAEAMTPAPGADDKDFSTRFDEWLTQELPRTLLKPPLRQESATVSPLSDQRDIPDERSETDRQTLGRTWAKRAAIAAACVAALSVVAVGASSLSSPLSGLMAAPALPALPARPALEVSRLVPPAAPPIEAPQAIVAGDYLVSVGLFASQERADQLVQLLTLAGLPAVQRPFQLRTERVQQVVLGPFANRADAIADLRDSVDWAATTTPTCSTLPRSPPYLSGSAASRACEASRRAIRPIMRDARPER